MSRFIRRAILYFVVFVLSGFLTLCVNLAAGGRDAAILAYHSIGEEIPEHKAPYISQEAFKKQMDFLYRHHYRVISLLDLAELLVNKKKIPARTVVITFDDGYRNNYTKAFPVLMQYHFPATIFMIADAVGKKDFMTASMLKEMSDSGLIAIGAHTRSHVHLPKIAKDEERLRYEISGSKEVLERILNKPVEAFCYPIGGYTPHVQEAVKAAGFRVAVTTLPREHGFAHEDVYALKRIKMTERSKDPFIFFIQTNGYFLRLKEISRRSK